MKSLSEQLKAQRKRTGLSLAQMAVRADTSAATLSRYENGWDRFEVRTLQKLATTLNCRLDIRLRPIRSTTKPGSRSAVTRQLGRLFWDRPLTAALLDTYPIWVLERVLDVGRLEDVHMLHDYWGRDVFLQRVAECRFTSAQTRRFWMIMLEREGIPCTRKFSRKTAFNS